MLFHLPEGKNRCRRSFLSLSLSLITLACICLYIYKYIYISLYTNKTYIKYYTQSVSLNYVFSILYTNVFYLLQDITNLMNIYI